MTSDAAVILCWSVCDETQGYCLEPTLVVTHNPPHRPKEAVIFGPLDEGRAGLDIDGLVGRIAVDGIERPTGLALDPDGTALWVAETRARQTAAILFDTPRPAVPAPRATSCSCPR